MKTKRKSNFTQRVVAAGTSFLSDTIRNLVAFLGEVIKRNLWIVIIVLSGLWFWDNRVDSVALKRFLSNPDNTLKEHQVARADADYRDNSLTLQKKDKPPKRVVGVKIATFIQNQDGTYEASYKNKGIGLEPGFVATAGDELRLGADVEYAYWKRWGLTAGFTTPVRGRSLGNLRGHLGLSYDIPNRWFNSSSVFGGIDTSKRPLLGIRTKFGGGI